MSLGSDSDQELSAVDIFYQFSAPIRQLFTNLHILEVENCHNLEFENLRSSGTLDGHSPWIFSAPEEPLETLEIFSRFNDLPKNLRRKIWNMSIQLRVVVLHYDAKNKKFVTDEPNIALLSVSHESRKCSRKIVRPTFKYNGSSRIIYLDVKHDIVLLDSGRLGDLGHMVMQWHRAVVPQRFRKMARLDIGLYENCKDSAMNCIDALGETFLLDQAFSGHRFTRVRLLAHTPFRCDLERHTAQMFTVDCEDQALVDWEEDLVAKIKEVNEFLLDVARYRGGPDINGTSEGAEGPIKLEFHRGFCGLRGIHG